MSKRLIKQMFGIALLLVLVFASAALCYAEPSNGDEWELIQPDGSKVKVKIYGDEFYQRVESIDGYTLIRDPETNWICYANLNTDSSDFVSTGVVYSGTPITIPTPLQGAREREPNALASLQKGLELSSDTILKKVNEEKESMGEDELSPSNASTLPENVVGLTVLVNFKDKQSSITRDQLDDLMNKDGYNEFSNNGSVKDYFYKVSNGKLTYTNIVTDFVTTKYKRSHYDDKSKKCGVCAKELVKEVLNTLEDQGFDFSTLTTDANNKVYSLNILFAGDKTKAGWGNGLWAHKGSLDNIEVSNNVYFNKYQISYISNDLSIGTIIHENGHLVCGWPDTYDYGNDSKGTSTFDLMGAGNFKKNPVPPNPYFRYLLAGWGELKDLKSYPYDTNIKAKPNDNGAFIYKSDKDSEFFIIQNIQKTKGTYYAKMPGSGLLIWHIDKNGNRDNQEMTSDSHYIVSVEQADGLYHLEKNTEKASADDLFNIDGNTEFNSNTAPNSKWWDGSDSGLDISLVEKSGKNIIFKKNNVNSEVE